MAPRAKVTDEENGPSTLPADFGEWDSGAPPTTLPDDFTDFDTTPKPPVKPPVAQAPPARPATASVPRNQAPVYAEVEAPAEPVQPARVKPGSAQKRKAEARVEARVQPRVEPEDEDEDEDEGKGKGKGKIVIIAIAAILLVAVGIFAVMNLRKSPSKAVVPNGTVTTEQVTAEPQTDSTGGAKPKPGAATTAPTTTTTPAAATTAADTAAPQETTPAPAQSAAMQAQLNAASKITINKSTGDKEAAPSGFSSTGLDSMGGSAGTPGVFNNGKGSPKVTAAEAPKTLNVSGSVMAGRLIVRNPPIYPRFARDAHVDGTVVLHAIISKAGTISSVSVISGPAMLRQAALDAVKTWRFRPYLLNNEPVEVETTVNVIFVLNG
jgi:protein TonB